jgi:hypothetical protein
MRWIRSEQARSILAIITVGLVIVWPLLNFQNGLMGVDAQVEGGWIRYLVDSIKHYGVFPNWSPLWLYGMEFTGAVPPFFLVLPALLTFATSNEFVAMNLVGLTSFIGAGIAMYYFVRRLVPESNLAATVAGMLYMLLPMHIEQVGHGQVSVIFSYAVLPLVALVLALTLEHGKPKHAVILGVLASVMALGQPELFYISSLFFLAPLMILMFWRVPAEARLRRLGSLLIAVLVFAALTTRYILNLFGLTDDIGFPQEQLQTISYYSYATIHDLFRIPDPVNEYGVRDLGYDAQHGIVAILLTAAALSVGALFSKARRTGDWIMLIMATLIATLGFILAFGPGTAVFDLARQLPFLGELRVAYRFYILIALTAPLLLALAYRTLTTALSRRIFLGAVVVMSLAAFRPYFTSVYPRLMLAENNHKRTQLTEYLTATDPKGSYRLLDYPCILNKDYLASIEPGKRIELTCSSLYWSQSFKNREYSDLVYRALLSNNPMLLDQFTRLYNIDYFLAAELHRPADKVPRLAKAKFGHAEAKDFFEKEYGALNLEPKVLENNEGNLTVYKFAAATEPDIRFFPLEGRGEFSLLIYDKPLDLFVWLLKLASSEGFEGVDFNYTLFVESGEWAKYALGGELDNWRVAVYDDGVALEAVRQGHHSQALLQPDTYEVRPDGIRLALTAPEAGILVLPYFFQEHWQALSREAPLKTLPVNGRQLGVVVPAGTQSIELKMKR